MEPVVISRTGQPMGRDKRLNQATLHVSHLWFPVNKGLLKEIKEGIERGLYDLDIDFLVSEIKSDFALFTYCLKEVTRSAAKEGVRFPENASPLEMLKLAGLPKLKSILLVEERKISAHTFETSNELQTARLKEAMVSATTAEVLSDSHKVDPNLGFTAGLLRQLGLTLIAWNYPTVYRRVMSTLRDKTDQNIDQALSESLGFSPALLGASLARQWHLSPEVRSAMGDKDASQALSENVIGKTLQKICEVGEALARANDPEHYPSAQADWETAKAEVESRIGYEGFKLIESKVSENFQNYLEHAPQTFKEAIVLDVEAKLHKVEEEGALESNIYVKNLEPILKKRIKELYRDINAAKVSKETIRTLVKEIVPLAGFTGGAIYTIDPAAMMLVPRTKIGKAELREIVSIPYNASSPSSDAVVSAFQCTTPIIENAVSASGDLCFVSCVLGEKQKVGVLYLETPRDNLDTKNENLLLVLERSARR